MRQGAAVPASSKKLKRRLRITAVWTHGAVSDRRGFVRSSLILLATASLVNTYYRQARARETRLAL